MFPTVYVQIAKKCSGASASAKTLQHCVLWRRISLSQPTILSLELTPRHFFSDNVYGTVQYTSLRHKFHKGGIKFKRDAVVFDKKPHRH